jgi:hypothetical protein
MIVLRSAGSKFSLAVSRRTLFFTTWIRRRPGGVGFWGTPPLSGSPPQMRYGVFLTLCP